MSNFDIIVVGYNCLNWAEKCLKSIFDQTYKNYNVIIINDASNDGTKEVIENFIKDKSNFKLINFEKNYGSGLYSINYAIEKIKNKDSIIITIDLDDRLPNNLVFERISKIYENKEIWMTYGNMASSDGSWYNILKEVQDVKNYRYLNPFVWQISHLRTFRKKLYDKINKNDFIDPNTNLFYKLAWDVAFFLPCLEMSGKEHSKYIEETLYIYNNQNPLSDFRKLPKEQIEMAKNIRQKKQYNKLEKLED